MTALVCGVDHVRRQTLDRPALTEREALLMNVGQAPLVEPLHRPLARLLELRRAGRTRTDTRRPAS